MSSRRSYRLTATTGLDNQGLCRFLERFKARQINIQKLVLVQSGNGRHCCELELVFAVPEDGHVFLEELEACLKDPEWREQILEAL